MDRVGGTHIFSTVTSGDAHMHLLPSKKEELGMAVKTRVSISCHDEKIVESSLPRGRRIEELRFQTSEEQTLPSLVTFSGGVHVSSTERQQSSVQAVLKDSVC